MASTTRANLRRRLCLAVVGAAVLAALTVATAARLGGDPGRDPVSGACPARRGRPRRRARQQSWRPLRPRQRPPRPDARVRAGAGRYRPVAIPPRLAATAPEGISPMGLNDRGQIVGEYQDQDGVDHGFLLDRGDRFTRIDVPGAKGTEAIKLNNRGQIVGAYSDTAVVLEPPRSPSGASCWSMAGSPGSTPRCGQQPGIGHQRPRPGGGRVPRRHRPLPRLCVGTRAVHDHRRARHRRDLRP